MGFFVPDSNSKTGLAHGPALLSVSAMRTWVKELKRVREEAGKRLPKGTLRVLGLLDLAVERAASPGEVRSTLLLSLPRDRGGYGLPRPALNVMTLLSPADAATYGVRGYVCDLTWDNGLIVEYRGEEVHKQPGRKVSQVIPSPPTVGRLPRPVAPGQKLPSASSTRVMYTPWRGII